MYVITLYLLSHIYTRCQPPEQRERSISTGNKYDNENFYLVGPLDTTNHLLQSIRIHDFIFFPEKKGIDQF